MARAWTRLEIVKPTSRNESTFFATRNEKASVEGPMVNGDGKCHIGDDKETGDAILRAFGGS